MKTEVRREYRVTENGFIKVYRNGELKSTHFNTRRQINGLERDGYVRVN